MLWKKDNYDILNESSPHETFGFPKERNFLQFPPVIQNFLIKTYNFNSIEQIDDIKKYLVEFVYYEDNSCNEKGLLISSYILQGLF